MNERFKAVRKYFQKTQKDFGALFGVSRDVVASIENGRVIPDYPYIQLLCVKLDIDEDWLLHGNGSMFIEKSRDEVIVEWSAKLVKSTGNDFAKRLATMLAQLDENEWALLEKMARNLLEDRKNNQD